jgi:putative nucleotidyltransferase with HDIG domain
LALKVLLIDPDASWLSTVAEYLQGQNYEVDTASNGKKGQLLLYNNNYFTVILNHETKDHSGMQVLKYISTNQSSQKLIYLLENNECIEDKTYAIEDFVKWGATEVLVKPITNEEIYDLLEGNQSYKDLLNNLKKSKGVSEEVEVTDEDEQFTKINIDEFYATKNVLFDVYVHLSSGKYIKILHSGDRFSKDRIEKYKSKQVEHLFFKNSDRRKYIQYTENLARKTIEHENATTDLKVRVLKSVAEKFVEEVFSVGIKAQTIEQGKAICEDVFTLVEQQGDLFKVLKSFTAFDPSAFNHSYLVTLFSTAIIKQFDWESKVTIEATALACMFHDIGKMKIPAELLEKRPEDMNKEELEQYQKHPELGAEMVDGNRLITASVKQIIAQHHEKYDGTGFPLGLKGNKILLLANIVGLADDFVHTVVKENLKPVEGLRLILKDTECVKKYNSKVLANFINVFVDPENIEKENYLPSNSKIVKTTNKKAS